VRYQPFGCRLHLQDPQTRARVLSARRAEEGHPGPIGGHGEASGQAKGESLGPGVLARERESLGLGHPGNHSVSDGKPYTPVPRLATRPCLTASASAARRFFLMSRWVNGSRYPRFRARSWITVQWSGAPSSDRTFTAASRKSIGAPTAT